LFIAGIGEQYVLLLFSAISVTKKTTMRGESGSIKKDRKVMRYEERWIFLYWGKTYGTNRY